MFVLGGVLLGVSEGVQSLTTWCPTQQMLCIQLSFPPSDSLAVCVALLQIANSLRLTN